MLVTRTTAEVHRLVVRPPARSAVHHEAARCITVDGAPRCRPWPDRSPCVCAGTSDLPVAEEAAVTASFHGATVDRIYDVGVAGLHRLLDGARMTSARPTS